MSGVSAVYMSAHPRRHKFSVKFWEGAVHDSMKQLWAVSGLRLVVLSPKYVDKSDNDKVCIAQRGLSCDLLFVGVAEKCPEPTPPGKSHGHLKRFFLYILELNGLLLVVVAESTHGSPSQLLRKDAFEFMGGSTPSGGRATRCSFGVGTLMNIFECCVAKHL